MEIIQEQSLFNRIGGMPAVNAAVDIFYNKVMQDARISHFFKYIDMSRQSGKLRTFLAYAFGAPMKYSGQSMHAAHQHMHITEEHFQAVAGHLVATLEELNVPESLINEVVAIALSVKGDIVKTPEAESLRA